MLTLLVYGLLAVAVVIGLFLLAANFLPAGEQIAPPIRDEPPWDLPASHRLDADDVASVRLPVALRGYRFAETDLLLDRLGEELRARDAEIERLRGRRAGEFGSGPRHAEPERPAQPDTALDQDAAPAWDATAPEWDAPPAQRADDD